MLIGFIIWSVIAVCFVVIAIRCRVSDTPVGFWANAKVPEVSDVKAYNKAVSNLWWVFTVLYEAIGLPLLLGESNSPLVLLTILLILPLVIGIMIVYTKIELKYRVEKNK